MTTFLERPIIQTDKRMKAFAATTPLICYLDEATSMLDATSPLLVFEALKRWWSSKTTIIITHDLSQIEATDFVYMLIAGRVVEQGYRGDLEKAEGKEGGEVCSMLGA